MARSSGRSTGRRSSGQGKVRDAARDKRLKQNKDRNQSSRGKSQKGTGKSGSGRSGSKASDTGRSRRTSSR